MLSLTTECNDQFLQRVEKKKRMPHIKHTVGDERHDIRFGLNECVNDSTIALQLFQRAFSSGHVPHLLVSILLPLHRLYCIPDVIYALRFEQVSV
jgi:hypothetical protein